jgi:hypothetical protein
MWSGHSCPLPLPLLSFSLAHPLRERRDFQPTMPDDQKKTAKGSWDDQPLSVIILPHTIDQ